MLIKIIRMNAIKRREFKKIKYYFKVEKENKFNFL